MFTNSRFLYPSTVEWFLALLAVLTGLEFEIICLATLLRLMDGVHDCIMEPLAPATVCRFR